MCLPYFSYQKYSLSRPGIITFIPTAYCFSQLPWSVSEKGFLQDVRHNLREIAGMIFQTRSNLIRLKFHFQFLSVNFQFWQFRQSTTFIKLMINLTKSYCLSRASIWIIFQKPQEDTPPEKRPESLPRLPLQMPHRSETHKHFHL